jgi:hypothetical protein
MAVSQIARYLVSKERGRALREDTRWFDGAAHERARRVVGPLRLERLPEFVPGALPVIDLRVAAGRFAGSHLPDATGYVRLEGIEPRDGMFVARVTGDSMNLVVPDGAWCLWEHLGAPGVAAPMPAAMTREDSPFRPGLFTGRVAIVTGGGTGIGRVVARELGQLGAKIAIAGRRPEPLEDTRAALSAEGIEVLAKTCDIRKPEEVQAFVAAVLERFGKVTILVNNAGGQFPSPRSTSPPRASRRSCATTSSAPGP